MANNFSLKSVIIIVIATALIVIVMSYLIFSYIPQQKKLDLISDYKKASYEAILCQYTCPLELQKTTENKTELLPNLNCVKACSDSLKQKNLNPEAFSVNDLKNDNFFSDILTLVDNCKKQSLNQTSLSLDTKSYVSCVSLNIKKLNQTYGYIN